MTRAMNAQPMRFVLSLLLASSLFALAEESLTGRWAGPAQIPGRELNLVLDLNEEGGVWRGSITIPGFGVKGAALTDVAMNGGELTCAIKGALTDQRAGPAKLKARFGAGGKLTGEFLQGGHSAPFVLERHGAPQVEAGLRSTPIAAELEGEWKGGYELFGYPRTVTLKLQNRGEEGATADFVIVGKRENVLPVDLVMQHGNFLTVRSSETGLSFEGRVAKGQIEGTVLQGPLEIATVLKRAK